MKNTKIFTLATIAAFGLAACAKESGENTGEGNNGFAEVVISFPLDTRAEGNSGSGEEGGVGVENEVNVIEFFTFEGTNPDAVTPYYRKTTNSLTTTSFMVSAGSKTFLVAVNANVFASASDYEASASTPANVTYPRIKAAVAGLELSSANSQNAPVTGTGYVMAGEGSRSVVAGETNNLSMTLDRAITKVMAPVVNTSGADVSAIAADLDYLQALFAGVTDVGDVTDLEWTFDGYVVINGILNSYNFRYVGWSGWTAPFVSPATGATWGQTTYTDSTGETIDEVYAGAATGDKFLPAGTSTPVFVYENKPEANPKSDPNEATTFKPGQVTGFLVKGHFTATVNGTSDTDSDPRYWRINLLKADSWEIYRNSVYRVTLNNVFTPGFGTPKEAEEDGPIIDPAESSISIDLDIAKWTIRSAYIDF